MTCTEKPIDCSLCCRCRTLIPWGLLHLLYCVDLADWIGKSDSKGAALHAFRCRWMR